MMIHRTKKVLWSWTRGAARLTWVHTNEKVRKQQERVCGITLTGRLQYHNVRTITFSTLSSIRFGIGHFHGSVFVTTRAKLFLEGIDVSQDFMNFLLIAFKIQPFFLGQNFLKTFLTFQIALIKRQSWDSRKQKSPSTLNLDLLATTIHRSTFAMAN